MMKQGRLYTCNFCKDVFFDADDLIKIAVLAFTMCLMAGIG